MRDLLPELQNEYIRLIRLHKPSEYSEDGCLSEMDVLKAYILLTDHFLKKGEQLLFGIKSFDLLSSAVNRQFVEFCGVKKWTTPYHKMAVLLYGLDKNHSLEDCNKRTALLSLLFQLHLNKLTPTCHKKALEDLCVRIADNSLELYSEFKRFKKHDEPEIDFIAHFLRINTRNVNKRFYLITFNQFNQRLNEFGYRLDNPKGNYIDVIREAYIEKRFGIFSIHRKEQKVIQVGFPGWKKQVNEKAAKSILKACNLTDSSGIDSDVFFHGEIPLYSLIDEYKNPLKRLKDK